MITVALADDHIMLRTALSQLVESFGKYKVILQASNGAELLENLDPEHLPDLVLVDINMPVRDGTATAKVISEKYPQVKMIALTMLDNEATVAEMIKNGVRGYVLKDADPLQLRMAMDNVVKNGFHFSERVTGRLIHTLQKKDMNEPFSNNFFRLTEREKEFLWFSCTEMTYREIATQMKVSPRTVDGYRDGLFEKLGIKSRVGLALYAVRARLFIMS